MNAMQLSEEGLKLIADRESYVGHVYSDFAGKLTIGFGHLMRHGDTYSTLTEPEAMDLLRCDVRGFESAVNRLVRVPLEQGQFDALVSFTFNLGTNALAGSTLLKKLNALDYGGASEEFTKWCHYTDDRGRLQISPTLQRRREDERALFVAHMITHPQLPSYVTSPPSVPDLSDPTLDETTFAARIADREPDTS